MSQTQPEFREWEYMRYDIHPDELGEALSVFYEKGFKGLNLTLPHKVHALDLIESVDPSAALMGAVNTLVRTETGYKGYNTDGFGLSMAVEEAFGVPMKNYPVVLLGAGGASRAIATQCLLEKVPFLYIGNRNQDRLQNLVNQLPETGVPVTAFDITNPPQEFPDNCLIINATSLGLKEEDPSPVSLEVFKGNCVVYDATYGVAGNGLSREALRRGFPYCSGLGMLVWQGAKALEYWTQSAVPVQAMRNALETV
jgi:shikimate dehydrogenase